MDSLSIALLIKPFALFAFFALIVIPVELALARFIPDCRLKVILFDRTLKDRRPEVFWIAVIVGYSLIGVTIYLVSSV